MQRGYGDTDERPEPVAPLTSHDWSMDLKKGELFLLSPIHRPCVLRRYNTPYKLCHIRSVL
jgi:hypothetical protein